MKSWPILAASLLALAGCEAVNEGGPDGPVFTLGTSCLPPAKFGAMDSTGLRVLYVSQDSLHFIVPVQLNCGIKYAFSASLPAPDTLNITAREVGGTTAKCTCTRELTVSLKAEAGQSLDKVKVLKTPSGIFPDFH